MPISIHIDETGVAVATCTGVLGRDQAQAGAATLWETPEWTSRSAVWDFRQAEFDLSTSEVRQMARFILEHQPTPPPSRVAFVTHRDIDFGMARVFGAHREEPGTEFRVFRDYAAAIRWAHSAGSDAV